MTDKTAKAHDTPEDAGRPAGAEEASAGTASPAGAAEEARSDLAGGAPPEAAQDTAAADAAADATDEHAALKAEIADLKDRLLRTLAEMENLRRRTAREIEDVRRYAVTAFARDVLALGDNLRRALDAVPADARANAADGLKGLLEGVEMTEREFLNVLGKYGVKKIDPTGEKFDPHLHQAMLEVPDPNAEPGTVVQVLQAGYLIGERVLRPAMVGVAKAVPAPSEAEGSK